jgi:hypothetical protein
LTADLYGDTLVASSGSLMAFSGCRRYAKRGNGSLVILPKYNRSTMRYAVQFCWRWSRPVTWGKQLPSHYRDYAEEKVQVHSTRCIDVRDECKLALASKPEMLVVLYSSTTWPCHQKVIVLTVAGALEFILDSVIKRFVEYAKGFIGCRTDNQASVCNCTYAGKEDPV